MGPWPWPWTPLFFTTHQPKVTDVEPVAKIEPIVRHGVVDWASTHNILWQLFRQQPAGRAVRVRMPFPFRVAGDRVPLQTVDDHVHTIASWAVLLAREPQMKQTFITVKENEPNHIPDADAWLKAKVLRTTANGRFRDLLQLDKKKSKLLLVIHDFSAMPDKDVLVLDAWCRAQNGQVSILILSGKYHRVWGWDTSDVCQPQEM
jgi:hypothetical protein